MMPFTNILKRTILYIERTNDNCRDEGLNVTIRESFHGDGAVMYLD